MNKKFETQEKAEKKKKKKMCDAAVQPTADRWRCQGCRERIAAIGLFNSSRLHVKRQESTPIRRALNKFL